MARYPLAIKVSNLLVYVFLLGANLYSALDSPEKKPEHPGHDNFTDFSELSELSGSPYTQKPTYISPAPFVFGVWGLIHFLLGGFVIYQFFGAHDLIVDGINWHFVCITLLNTLWLVLWETKHPILAWFTILFTSAQVTFVYKVLKNHREDGCTINEQIWVHAPFSLYHAWIFVMVVVNTFASFSHGVSEDGPTVLMKILVVIALLILESTAVGYIEGLKGDIAGAIVIDWALYGIAVQQDDPIIHWTALVLAVITSLHILKPIVRKFVRGSEESTPLLG